MIPRSDDVNELSRKDSHMARKPKHEDARPGSEITGREPREPCSG